MAAACCLQRHPLRARPQVYVHPDHRGRGIGRRLMRMLLRQLMRDKGIYDIGAVVRGRHGLLGCVHRLGAQRARITRRLRVCMGVGMPWPCSSAWHAAHAAAGAVAQR